ncbi:MAG: hypothetical protein GTO02_06915, partial [Candidatus Dadabacteria bacterium]|nr:hypothetical protein [Candidatus Dadabacteria bacterium]
FITLRQMVNVDYYIFKFVRANMLIEWLTKNFPLKKPVFIIRHPCAVVSSILNLSWDSNCKLSPEFYNHYPFFNEIINHAKTEEEKFAVLWCQENYVALNQSKPYSFILISYEKLISEPINELKKIFNEWEIEFPPEILSNFSIPSKTFNMNRDNHYIKNNKIDSLKLLGRWKSDLSTKQIDRILKIVNMCGMDFYTDNLEPDYNRLYSDKPIYLPKN